MNSLLLKNILLDGERRDILVERGEVSVPEQPVVPMDAAAEELLRILRKAKAKEAASSAENTEPQKERTEAIFTQRT